MHAISGRYHKPKSRPSKKKRAAIERMNKRWSSVSENSSRSEVNSNKIVSGSSNSDASTSHAITSELPVQPECSTVKKLSIFPALSHSDDASENSSYVLMSHNMWSSLLCNIKCDECFSNSLDVVSKSAFGFSAKLELICKTCQKVHSSTFSSPRENDSKGFEANKKLVEAFLKIGKGHAALEVFSMAIGVHAMDKKTFSKCMHMLYEEKQNFKEDVLEMARNIVRSSHEDQTDGNIYNITVSYDGTWQKRGHTSLYGIGFVIDILTGLVVDYEILSKYCPECTTAKRDLGEKSAEYMIWHESHLPNCSANHSGTSGSMEMIAAEKLWKRSISNCNMRYVGMLSDGDSKTYQHLVALNLYGDIKVQKEECINHVAKRLGTGLRNKVKEWRSKGVTIGGRKEGSLKEDTINKLTNYFRKAIKDNVPDVDKMKSAVYASVLHCSSSNKSPKHNKCPSGETSWCFYQRAIAKGERPQSHTAMKTKISEDVVAKILPVYQRLASNELLARCTSGKTQNANESLHSVIWQNCPKETFVSKKRLEMSVISSVSNYNFGCLNSLGMQKDINLQSLIIAERRDKRRISQAKNRNKTEWKEQKNNKKYNKCLKNAASAKKEGKTYGAGEF